MFTIDSNYTQYRDDYDPNYPGGKAIPAPTGDSIEGTEWRDLLFNQIIGFFQAVILDAYDTLLINGKPDNARESDVLEALKVIIQRYSGVQLGIGIFVKPIEGIETIIPHAELNINYNYLKKYPVFVSADGNYQEFVSFNAEMLNDGLHIRPMRFVDGQLIPGTRPRDYIRRKWGTGKWGTGKWLFGGWTGVGESAFESMPVNIIIKEL